MYRSTKKRLIFFTVGYIIIKETLLQVHFYLKNFPILCSHFVRIYEIPFQIGKPAENMLNLNADFKERLFSRRLFSPKAKNIL